MPAKEIKELRQSGKLKEAYIMAKSELDLQPENIFAKRNISWVYYEYLKLNALPEKIDNFISSLNEIINLNLPKEDYILSDTISFQIGKMIFKIVNTQKFEYNKAFKIYELAKFFSYTKPSEGYSFLFKSLHKFHKDGNNYISFADWWDFENFGEKDFQKETITGGKEVMSIVEQAYIAYAKHLLPKQNGDGTISFDKEKALAFIEKLSALENSHPEYEYPSFFKAKLLLHCGNNKDMLTAFLPFAKAKRNNFWIWELFADVYSAENDTVFACYCKALTCKSPGEMLIGLRQKMAKELISRNLLNEAKTEIEALVKIRIEKEYKIPNEVFTWQSQDWYKNGVALKSNFKLYEKYAHHAESVLFFDIQEELIFVESVNYDKKILNFIASETKFGFLKYDKFFKNINAGDVLKVRFQESSKDKFYSLYTAEKFQNEEFKKNFLKDVQGKVNIQNNKNFGFIDDIFIHPSLIIKYNLVDSMDFIGKAIKSYNKEKQKFTWKLI
ncbi:DUF7017 domain-containing protein [Flavobacterium branchiophilum]|uniref:Uncharacterized protein n=1 Tax=Flavobacterium branchiophilum TaxID=55197 RepID=A0A2H3KNF7_9FLAO|nr:hypothetical protein [Flavobacterium branchiophilum]PDS22407.1 hypothetical protein B0A77_13530 [Flavobacterium branchiophilum]